MSHQGPLVVVSSGDPSLTAASLSDINVFPVVETNWADAEAALRQTQPVAVVAVTADDDTEHALAALAGRIAAIQPYVPLIAIDPKAPLPGNALPFSHAHSHPDGLNMRLTAALRVRTLHATVLRRLSGDIAARIHLPKTDPIADATALLIGRGATYPTLSVALGEQLGVVGALSIEAAAKHLNARELNGIVIGEGFSARVVDAFLTVLAEDTRFRNLPVAVIAGELPGRYDLPNLESMSGSPEQVVANVLPMIRQNAFEARLIRTLKSIDAGGLLDPRTGLLTTEAFHRDLATAVYQTQSRGGGLSVARFTFGQTPDRILFDAARVFSRLMRRMDFGTLEDDGSIVVVFAEADLRNAHMIARRLASVVKHTLHDTRRSARIDPKAALATLLPEDSARSLLARLSDESRRAAS